MSLPFFDRANVSEFACSRDANVVAAPTPTLPRLGALSEITESVAAAYGVEPADITGRARTKSIAEARMLCCLVARRCTRLSYPEIGMVLGRDHTTVMALVKSAERQRARDPWFAATAAELLERFGEIEEARTQ